MTTEVTHLRECDKSIFRIGIPTQINKQKKKTPVLSKIFRFSRLQQLQKKELFTYYTEKDKQGRNVHR